MAWTIEYADTAKGQLRKLDKQTARRIVDFMAARKGTTQSVEASIESGRGTPSMRTVQRFAKAVGARAVVRMEPLKTWYGEACRAEWKSPAEVKAQYGNASIVGNNRIVFNIAGSKYRLIVAIAYRMQIAYVKFVGTHAEYDKVDAATVDQS